MKKAFLNAIGIGLKPYLFKKYNVRIENDEDDPIWYNVYFNNKFKFATGSYDTASSLAFSKLLNKNKGL